MDKNIFMYYWKTIENTESRNFYTEIRGYGMDEDNQNTCIRIKNFSCRCFLEFSDNDYLVNDFANIKQHFLTIVFNRNDQDCIKLVYKKKLYGQNSTLLPFVEMKFQSRIMMYSFRKKILSLPLRCNVKFHEVSVPNYTQLTVDRDVPPTGWIKVKSCSNLKNEDEKVTRCVNEYFIGKDQLEPVTLNKLIDVKILSWDIEAKCEDISKNPGNCTDDYVFQISCIFYSLLSNRLRKVLLTLGECDEFSDDVEIIRYETETKLILGFTEIIVKEQPNIITGWNIFKFDINYMLNRAERLMCLSEFTSFGMNKGEGEIINIKWSSKAFQTTDIKYIDAEGVLSIDLLEVVRKDYKLDSYKLNSVSKHFLNEEKDDMSLKDLLHAFRCYENKTHDYKSITAKVGKYCVQDSKLVIDLFVKLQTWLGLAEMSKTTNTPIMTVHLQGQQRKFYNQIYKYCYYQNVVVEDDGYKSKLTDNYTGAYVFDPIPGLYNYVVPFDFESLYPSIIIAYNFDYTTIVPEDSTEYPEDTLNIIEWEDHIGCEHDPLVIQKNALTQLIDNCSDKLQKTKLRSQRSDITKKINKRVICQKHKFKFLKPEIYGKGILPTIIQNLLDARKEVRKQMKSITDPQLLNVLNQRQLSFKVSANSMYGATGVKRGALPFMPVAMCVTAIGRKSIQKTAELLKSVGGTIVYGDSDSNYIMFENIKGTHLEKCEKIWNKSLSVSEEISKHFPKPMRLAFEEVIYYKFMILTKKRYMYYSCKQDGTISEKIGQKGVLLARRDQSMFTKTIYEKTVMNVFDGKSKEDVMNNITEHIHKLLTMQLDWNMLKINKSVNDFDDCKIVFDETTDKYKMGMYTVPAPPEEMTKEESLNYCIGRLPAQVQLEIKRLNRDEEKTEGSRLDYVVTRQPGKNLKQSDKVEEFSYFMRNKDILKIDYMYYIERLVNPLEQIFESIYHTDNYVLKNLKYFGYRNNNITELKYIFSPNLNVLKIN